MENSLIENIEDNASKYDDNRDNLKVRFIDVCNKENELGKIYTENDIKKFNLVMNIIKSHMEFMDSLASVKPIVTNYKTSTIYNGKLNKKVPKTYYGEIPYKIDFNR